MNAGIVIDRNTYCVCYRKEKNESHRFSVSFNVTKKCVRATLCKDRNSFRHLN